MLHKYKTVLLSQAPTIIGNPTSSVIWYEKSQNGPNWKHGYLTQA